MVLTAGTWVRRAWPKWGVGLLGILGLTFGLGFRNVWGQTISGAGTTAAPFLKIGVGGRAVGMGEAHVTLAEDITGVYWNPAGVANIPGLQILLNHFDYLADLHYEFAAAALPVTAIGTFGVSFSYLGMPDIERTTVTFPEGNGEQVSAYSFAVGLTYARALTDRFSIGGTAKLVRETIWHSSATGLAFDVGLLYRAFFRNVRIGMCIANFGGDMRMSGRDMLVQHDIAEAIAGNNRNINAHLDTDAFPLPILFRVGLSANVARDFLGMEHYDWILAADAVHPSDNKEFLNVGTELRLRDLIALRAGYRQLFLEDREGGLSVGAGLHLRLSRASFWLDYAVADYGRLDRQNKFSLLFAF
ncbi:MAG: PorV/PorQ family protein [candidate division KSB1 bacterium]|nr:PorV/PorQ family protein [candidate division KSB1 bacterium]